MTTPPPSPTPAAVTVTDVRMPFLSMVVFMVKWAVAAIPALLLLALVGGVAGTALVGAVRGRATPPAAPSVGTIMPGVGTPAVPVAPVAADPRQAARDSLRAVLDAERARLVGLPPRPATVTVDAAGNLQIRP